MKKKSADQGRVSKWKRLIKRLGPGFITGASDDDPSGIATYSQAGAQFGLITLWTALLLFPMMLAIQEMCARIGLVTGEGLTSNIKKHYARPLLWVLLFFSIPAIILNISADIAGIGAVANLVVPSVSPLVFDILFVVLLSLALIFLSYRRIVNVLKYLCLSLLLYMIVPFLSKQNWTLILKYTLMPTIQFNKEYLSILVAILGTTISPYLFFWQATIEAEEKKHQKQDVVNRQQVSDMNKDVGLGMFSSNLVMYFIILTTGTVLYQGGIHHIATVEQAALALQPLAGKLSFLLFALGILGTGILSIPILCGCISYMLSAAFSWGGGLDKKFSQANYFYVVIILSLLLGLAINFIGLNPIKALLYTAIMYGLTAPVFILIILHICNNKKIMGNFTNGVLANTMGGITFVSMFTSMLLLLNFYIF